jgi:hypothetical protein
LERRRRRSQDDKARIVEETLAPGAKVTEVARRNGVGASVVFTWRRQARTAERVGPCFAPVQIAAAHRYDAGGRRLKVDLLGHIQGIIYLNPEIPDSALEFRMAKEELHFAQVSGLAIDLGRLRTPHRVRTING